MMRAVRSGFFVDIPLPKRPKGVSKAINKMCGGGSQKRDAFAAKPRFVRRRMDARPRRTFYLLHRELTEVNIRERRFNPTFGIVVFFAFREDLIQLIHNL